MRREEAAGERLTAEALGSVTRTSRLQEERVRDLTRRIRAARGKLAEYDRRALEVQRDLILDEMRETARVMERLARRGRLARAAALPAIAARGAYVAAREAR